MAFHSDEQGTDNDSRRDSQGAANHMRSDDSLQTYLGRPRVEVRIQEATGTGSYVPILGHERRHHLDK